VTGRAARHNGRSRGALSGEEAAVVTMLARRLKKSGLKKTA